MSPQLFHAGRGIRRHVDGESVLLKAARDAPRNSGLILDGEHGTRVIQRLRSVHGDPPK
ncbi:MAG TPA: hypothetical protein VFK57_13350 [Vicinamibacterales bacterium]|nr:hypothetical protein [Vicinamibacterales bacterium]